MTILAVLAWVSTHIALVITLIPISTLGFIRFGVWILKRALGVFYRPIQNDYTTTATIVTPVFKEDPRLFRQALESWIANRPDCIIVVVDVSDKP
jgi:cellulose synthase/poly-beta-1,6-N-acetylglucosamine synthase-like glycosyltransferase